MQNTHTKATEMQHMVCIVMYLYYTTSTTKHTLPSPLSPLHFLPANFVIRHQVVMVPQDQVQLLHLGQLHWQHKRLIPHRGGGGGEDTGGASK